MEFEPGIEPLIEDYPVPLTDNYRSMSWWAGWKDGKAGLMPVSQVMLGGFYDNFENRPDCDNFCWGNYASGYQTGCDKRRTKS